MSRRPAVPALTPPAKPKKLSVAAAHDSERHRASVALRRPGVPMAELRLRMPFLAGGTTHPARALVLSDTMLTGTAQHDRAALAIAVQSLGADVSVSVDADRLLISANVLASALPRLLDAARLVLDRGELPQGRGRDRARAVGREGDDRPLARRHDRGGAARGADVGRASVRARPAAGRRHRGRRRRRRCARCTAIGSGPAGATLVVVGDVSPARVLDQVERALGAWTGTPKAARVARAADARSPARCSSSTGPVRCSPRCGWARRRCRATTRGIPRCSWRISSSAATSPRAGRRTCARTRATPTVRTAASTTTSSARRLMFDVEVASEVTAPALLETSYELGRIASLPVTDGEVDAVRQYAIGNLAMATATQAGLASTLSALVAHGSRAGLADLARGAPGRDRPRRRLGGSGRVLRTGPADLGDRRRRRRRSPRRSPRSGRSRHERPTSRCRRPRSTGRRTAVRDDAWLADAWRRARVVALSPKSATPVTAGDAPHVALRRPPTSRTTHRAGSSAWSATTCTSPRRWSRTMRDSWQTLREIGARADDLEAALLVSAVGARAVAPAAHALPAVRRRRPSRPRPDGRAPAPPTAASTSRAPIPP